MERIIEKPHLPKGEVRCLIIGEKYRNKLGNALNRYKIDVICAENNKFVDERLSGHVDLSLVHLGSNELIGAEYLYDSELFNKLRDKGFELKFTSNPTDNAYPRDAGLNVCILNDFVICNPKTANEAALADRKIISCKQGYTKCSICVVDDKSIITSDELIAKNSALYGIEALLIDDSFIKLQGFNKGFIGGASFKLSKDKIAFTGIINDSETRKQIESFLNERSIGAVYLTDEEIFDIGSAIPIIEEI